MRSLANQEIEELVYFVRLWGEGGNHWKNTDTVKR